jgi:hypothetical protein
MSGKEFSSRSEGPDSVREAGSPEALYKFDGQHYRLQRLDLSSLRAERGDMSMAGTLRYIRGSVSEPGLHVAVHQAAVALGFDSYTYGCLMQRVDGTPLLYVSTPFTVGGSPCLPSRGAIAIRRAHTALRREHRPRVLDHG